MLECFALLCASRGDAHQIAALGIPSIVFDAVDPRGNDVAGATGRAIPCSVNLPVAVEVTVPWSSAICRLSLATVSVASGNLPIPGTSSNARYANRFRSLRC
jgi:hypothetical protein